MKKINNIKVLIADPENGITVKEVPNTLKTFQELVGGHIEVLRREPEWALILDEEGKLKGKAVTAELRDYREHVTDVLVGTVVAVGIDDEDFCSLTDEQAEAMREDLERHVLYLL
ncbi:MAG: DUF3846 domain-containing protein [Clostridia bacterium]|nr:DUF3846 domain-containing protein [Clostridia bacterium]